MPLHSTIHDIDTVRRIANDRLNPDRKSDLGQFMTPSPVARFMASMFERWDTGNIKLLDAGAGVGSLASAFLDRWMGNCAPGSSARVVLYEIERLLIPHLRQTLENRRSLAADRGLTSGHEIHTEDFIETASCDILLDRGTRFTHAILNPPYKKISSHSRHRLLLRKLGIETVNLYPAFVALAIALLENGGEIVAIIPRSFCNGPYYLPFRKWIMDRAAITHIHLFGSRKTAFKEDGVLQENIIMRMVHGEAQGDVVVSTSHDPSLIDFTTRRHDFTEIVRPSDRESVIHIPSVATRTEFPTIFRYSLKELGLEVSTGPVVDFRLKEHLRAWPESETVPLIYPCHFSKGTITHPIQGKKPNAIERNLHTEKWLFPNGYYTVVRRFSSKEEKRRVVASVVEPLTFNNTDKVAFENHINVFHSGKCGIPRELARGLALFLNSTIVDTEFRTFSGHTQVNATDLRRMRYPSNEFLIALGEYSPLHDYPDHTEIDEMIDAQIRTR